MQLLSLQFIVFDGNWIFTYSRRISFEIASKIKSTPNLEIELFCKPNSRICSSLRLPMLAMRDLTPKSLRLLFRSHNFKLERRVIFEIAAGKEIIINSGFRFILFSNDNSKVFSCGSLSMRTIVLRSIYLVEKMSFSKCNSKCLRSLSLEIEFDRAVISLDVI